MSMALDVKIGRLAYGWTEEQTEKNDWYDPWAQLWRPKPLKSVATPAYSGSLVDALKFVRDIHCLQGITTTIVFDGRFFVLMNDRGNTSELEGNNLPETIVSCFINLKEAYEYLSQFPIPVQAQELCAQAG